MMFSRIKVSTCFLLTVIVFTLYIIMATTGLLRNLVEMRDKPEIKPGTVCKTFEFQPAEWTLYLKTLYNKKIENSRCQTLYDSTFKDKAVKWIVYPDKTKTNIGCTKSTPACKKGAHFDMKRNIRINTPPCCRTKMLELLKILTTGFQRLKIPHVLFGGSVIGWIRSKQMIPYDEDLDMIINGSFWRSTKMMTFLKNICKKHGFLISWRYDKESFSIDYSKQNLNGIGVWSYRLRKGKVHVINYSTPDFAYNTINPPRLVKFSGIITYVPNNPKQYCDDQYGKGKWEKELNCTKTYKRKCIR